MEKNIPKHCPICKKDLEMDSEFSTTKIDFVCRRDNHFYGHRIKNDQVTMLKARVMDENKNKFYLKSYYDKGIMEIWTKANDAKRTIINNIFEPDFSDIDKLIVKIKTYLLFL